MAFSEEIIDTARAYVEADQAADVEIDKHIGAGHVRQDGSRVQGPDYSMLDHWDTRARYFYNKLAKLLPNEQTRQEAIYDVMPTEGEEA